VNVSVVHIERNPYLPVTT